MLYADCGLSLPLSLTTTAHHLPSHSINTILANPNHWAGRARWETTRPDSTPTAIATGTATASTTATAAVSASPPPTQDLYRRPSLISLADTVQALMAAPWSGDAFQTPLLVSTVVMGDVDNDW